MPRSISLQHRLAKSASEVESRYATAIAQLCSCLLAKFVPDNAQSAVLDALGKQYGSFQSIQAAGQRSNFSSAGLAQVDGWVRETFGLSAEEDSLLAFLALHAQSPALQLLCDRSETVSSTRGLIERLAVLLDMPWQSVQQMISHTESLRVLKLLRLQDPVAERPFMEALEMRPSLTSAYFGTEACSTVLNELLIQQLPESTFDIDAFSWLNSELQVAVQYLKAVRERGTPNANILLYGPPGCGKSELASALAKACGYQAYAVVTSDHEHDILPDFVRMQLFHRYQRMFSGKSDALIVYENADEVFGRQAAVQQATKEMLIAGSAPVIWISEHFDQITPGHLKRFDMRIGVPAMPADARQALIKQSIASIDWSEENLGKLEKLRRITPVEIHAAAKVMNHLDGQSQTAETLLGLLRNNAGNRPRPAPEKQRQALDSHYSAELTNTSIASTAILNGISRSPAARICFYGLPGTGKTALAQHLADTLGRPLIACAPSDLLGPYVGQTERQIAEVFRRAEQERAVLLLDEIDAVLPNRQTSRHNFEMAMVNEMLIQMDNFKGLLVGTTNRLEQMDPAVLRRFDIKVEFLAMNARQVSILLANTCRSLGIEEPEADPKWPAALQCLGVDLALVPGNFATARRRIMLCSENPSVLELALAVEQEARHAAPMASRPIGFSPWPAASRH